MYTMYNVHDIDSDPEAEGPVLGIGIAHSVQWCPFPFHDELLYQPSGTRRLALSLLIFGRCSHSHSPAKLKCGLLRTCPAREHEPLPLIPRRGHCIRHLRPKTKAASGACS